MHTRATHVESTLLGAPQPSTPLSCGWHHWLFWRWPKLRTPNIFTIRPDSTVEVWIMPTAQEIRAYLELFQRAGFLVDSRWSP